MSLRAERVLNLLLHDFKVAQAAGEQKEVHAAASAIWNVVSGACGSGGTVRAHKNDGRIVTLRSVAPLFEDGQPISSLVSSSWPTYSWAHNETIPLASVEKFVVLPRSGSIV